MYIIVGVAIINVTVWPTFMTLYSVKILNIGADEFYQTVKTQIRLLQQEQSDQGLRRLPIRLHIYL